MMGEELSWEKRCNMGKELLARGIFGPLDLQPYRLIYDACNLLRGFPTEYHVSTEALKKVSDKIVELKLDPWLIAPFSLMAFLYKFG